MSPISQHKINELKTFLTVSSKRLSTLAYTLVIRITLVQNYLKEGATTLVSQLLINIVSFFLQIHHPIKLSICKVLFRDTWKMRDLLRGNKFCISYGIRYEFLRETVDRTC